MIKQQRQQGMTLIEILISMVIGAFLIGGILQIFLNSKQTYRMQENLSRMQENGRFALDFISRDVRNADFWGCINPADIENKLNPASTFDPFANGIAGQENDNNGNDGDSDNDENNNNIWDGTDTLVLRGASGSLVTVQDQPTTTAASLKVINNSGLEPNDIVIISNCTSGDIFQITDVTASSSSGFDNIIHNTGNVSSGPGNASSRLEIGPEPSPPKPNDNKYGSDSSIYKLNFIEYQIREGQNNLPALFKSTNGGAFQELIEGIESMQLLYGADTDGDNVANYYVDAATVLDWSQVISVKVKLLVVSPDDNLTVQPVKYTFNGTTSTPTDRKLRREFSSTIVLRNRLP